MEIKQIYEMTNNLYKEIVKGATIVSEDLSNIADIGDEVFNAEAHKNYLTGLVDHIGRVLFVTRKYTGSAPSVLMDAWEYGSVMEKVHAETPDAIESEEWELEDGASYDPNIFRASKVSAKFYNKRYTYTVPLSVPDRQLKSAFSSAQQMGSFVDMLYNEVDKAITVRIDALVMRTINNAIASTMAHDIPDADYGSKSTARCVNLLKLYNDEHDGETGFETLTVKKCMKDKEFLRFCALELKLYVSRLSKMSTLFNLGETAKFTGRDYLKIILHSEFLAGADVYLQSQTWHEEFTKMPSADEVAFWQGSGSSFAFEDTSTIKCKTASGDTVEIGGIVGCMFDRDALGVLCAERKTTSSYNPVGEFTNLWYKQFAGSFNDFNENFVVFYVADEE